MLTYMIFVGALWRHSARCAICCRGSDALMLLIFHIEVAGAETKWCVSVFGALFR